jgi:hypothetical protein
MVNVEPNSNVSDSSDSHREKHPWPSIRTDAGMHIERSDRQPSKACGSICVSFDPDSNVKFESNLHSEKQNEPRNSIDAGIQIVSSDRK